MSEESHDHHHSTHDHSAHDHGGHAHGPGGHGPVVHRAAADVAISYTNAVEAAVPAPGRSVVKVDLNAGEIDWEFVQGHKTRAWGFNGQVPGPTLEARVGDVLEIRLTNNLPEPTTIHWHGLQIPAAMDGTDMVQHPIMPGETFTYRFRLPDAGTFWYHPHMLTVAATILSPAFLSTGRDSPVSIDSSMLLAPSLTIPSAGTLAPGRIRTMSPSCS